MRRFIIFGVVGLCGVGVNLAAYYALLLFGAPYLLASFLAWVAALLVGYVLNRTFTFRSRAAVSHSLPRVVLVYALQQAVMLGSMAGLVELAGISAGIAYLIVLPPCVALSFFALRDFAFRDHPPL